MKKCYLLTLLCLLYLSFSAEATFTYLWFSDSDPFGGQLWDQPSNWWLQGGVPGGEDVPDGTNQIAEISEVQISSSGHLLDLYGMGAFPVQGILLYPVTQAYSITPGLSDSPGSFSFTTTSAPTPYITVTTTSNSWSSPNTISADISVTSDLIITVGPYTGSNKELVLSGAVTGEGNITKNGACNLKFTNTVECNIDIGNGNLIFNGVENFSNIISGSGNFEIHGTDILRISSAQTLTGSISLVEGTLVLIDSADLSTAEFLSLDKGTSLIIEASAGNIEIPDLTGSGSILLNNDTLTINQTFPSIYSGIIFGDGNLTKTGAGKLILQGTSIYTGPTTISAGELSLTGSGSIAESSLVTVNGTLILEGDKSIKDLAGSGEINLEGNTLTLSLGGSGDFTGVIADGENLNGGNIIKTGEQTATLSGNNTFTGNLTLSNGGLNIGGSNAYTGSTYISSNGNMLIENSGSIANSRQVLVDGSIIFDGSSSAQTINNLSGSGSVAVNNAGITVSETLANGALLGSLTGTGDLTKTGSMSLTLAGNSSPFLGTTTVSEGGLIINGSLGGDVDVEANGTLKGNGTIGTGANTVTNSGTVAPGTSIGTLTISGDYTQSSTGNLEVEIAGDGSTDLLSVTGTATLNGTVTIAPLPGLYKANTSYDYVIAATRSGFFTQSVELNQVTGVFSYSGTTATYTLSNSAPVLPVPIFSNVGQGLKGNAQRIAKYLFRVGDLPNNIDLEEVYIKILALNSTYFPVALQRLGPTQFGALPLVSLQSGTRAADIFLSNYRRFVCCRALKKEETNQKRNLWIQPLFYKYTQSVYNQEENLQEQIKFTALTYGSMLGSIFQLSDQWFLSPGIGYTHTNLRWEKKAGKAEWNTLYLAPSIGLNLDCCRTYANFTLLGAINFYDVYRHIYFSGLNRIAHNNHTSFDILGRFDSGCLFKWNHFFIQPEATFNTLLVLEPQYTEDGANSLNLTVFRKTNVYFRTQFITRFGFSFGEEQKCFSPNVKIGWVSDIPVTNGFYHSRLRNETFLTGNEFPVLSFHRTTAQLVVGGELTLKFNNFLIFGEFSANYLDYSIIQMGRLRLDWEF